MSNVIYSIVFDTLDELRTCADKRQAFVERFMIYVGSNKYVLRRNWFPDFRNWVEHEILDETVVVRTFNGKRLVAGFLAGLEDQQKSIISRLEVLANEVLNDDAFMVDVAQMQSCWSKAATKHN
jgi:hypothetical protein